MNKGANSLPPPSSWASPCTCARSLSVGHRAPGDAPPLCPKDPADKEPLNGLDFCSRNLMDVFISTCWSPVLLFGGHCGTWHSHHPFRTWQRPQCPSFVWLHVVWAWCHMTAEPGGIFLKYIISDVYFLRSSFLFLIFSFPYHFW